MDNIQQDMQHTHSCSKAWRNSDEPCTCGLEFRKQLSTEKVMHMAWRKRAEEAEARLLPSDEQLWKMIQAYNALEYPKHECLECDGTGREQDNTPCSNPNEAATCRECNGKGYWRKDPSQFDRMKAAINAMGSPNG